MKYADLIAVEGDALADLKSFMHVGFVMNGGVVIRGAEGQECGPPHPSPCPPPRAGEGEPERR